MLPGVGESCRTFLIEEKSDEDLKMSRNKEQKFDIREVQNL